MSDFSLTAFWIEGPDPRGPLGYGVTAFSLADAFEIVVGAGYRLPDDKHTLRIRAEIKPADLEHRYVREHMGPIVVRGLQALTMCCTRTHAAGRRPKTR